MNCHCPNSSYGVKHTPACYEARIAALEARLEVYDASGKHYLGVGDTDGIGCRNETIKLQDERIAALEARNEALAGLLRRVRNEREVYADMCDDIDAALATELPLSARVEAKIARECFANEPGPTQGETHADPAIAAAVRRTSLNDEVKHGK